MKSEIKKLSNSLGISKVGFTDILDLSYLLPIIKERKDNKYNCEFEESNIYKRVNIKDYFPQVNSIIVGLFPYAHGYKSLNEHKKGNLSVSSYGLDYHNVVREKLNKLSEAIDSKYKHEYKICVDTSPLLDRAICKNAGLGYIGKNNMFINDIYGSFTFIGYILTSLNIESENNIINNKCGDCKICINKCPNSAIKSNGIIDTNRCLSYLTQTKKYIPFEYRVSMGNQIYGCDVCQINCPKNKKILDIKTSIDYSSLLIDIEDILTISNKDFKRKYGVVAGSWRGKNIWKRNAIIVCANQQLRCYYDILKQELYSKNDMIKMYAAWTIMKLDRIKSKDILNNMLKYENDIVKDEYKKILEVVYE